MGTPGSHRAPCAVFPGADPWSNSVDPYRCTSLDLGSESPGYKNVAMVLTHYPIGPASLVGLLIPGLFELNSMGPAGPEQTWDQ